ncbi:matrix protein Mmp37 [Toxoplasma gondii FOU]|uniref:Matrix protein Mmp37 n=2 Tax=Toxoplasma gondii TaxID=5811 RepID=A0A086LHZ9_TOXGO|nr:matrix protein Mmp37 [Toxoplasma gondii FOU]PUA86539.1 matrix protein Mmp37 [Toxoplasma gondii TgCATBr9]
MSSFHVLKNPPITRRDKGDPCGSLSLNYTRHAVHKPSVPHVSSFVTGEDEPGKHRLSASLAQAPSSDSIIRALAGIVRQSSTISALKNAVSAGLPRTIIYGVQKIAKRWKR